MPFVEFAYNHVVYSSTGFSPFQLVYGYNPLTPLDLLPLPIDHIDSLDGKKKAKLAKKLHEQTRVHIEKKNAQYVSHANKGRKVLVF